MRSTVRKAGPQVPAQEKRAADLVAEMTVHYQLKEQSERLAIPLTWTLRQVYQESERLGKKAQAPVLFVQLRVASKGGDALFLYDGMEPVHEIVLSLDCGAVAEERQNLRCGPNVR